MLQVLYSIFHFTTSTQPFLPETHCWIEGHHALFQPTIELQIGVNSFVAFWEKRILIEQHEEGKQAKKGCQCCLWLSESLISYFYEQPILKGLKCNTHVVSFVWTNVIWMSIKVWLTNKKDLVFSLFPRSRHFILHLLYKSSWLYIIFVYKVQNRAKVSWNMTCLTNGQAIKRNNHQKEKSFMLVWQKPSKWSTWWE